MKKLIKRMITVRKRKQLTEQPWYLLSLQFNSHTIGNKLWDEIDMRIECKLYSQIYKELREKLWDQLMNTRHV